MRLIHLVVYLCLLLTFALPTAAQEQTTSAPEATTVKTKYNEAGKAFKQAYAQIETLRGEYQNADEGRRKEINAELPALLDEAQSRMDDWASAGLQLYKVAPNEDQQLADWLLGIAKYYSVGERFANQPPNNVGGNYQGGDQYELALPIIQALIDGGHPEKNLYLWGGMSALCVNEYELAREYLTAADEAGLFEGLTPSPNMSPDELFPFTVNGFYAKLDEFEKQWEEEKKIREAEAATDDLPRVKLSTTKGDMVVELYENEAPQATANFLTLAKSGYFNGLDFHRVLPHFMAQGGDNGRGGPGYTIRCECYEPGYRRHFRGVLSMAKPAQPPRDSGSAQFFMCFVPTDHLNGKHTAFGRVVEGLDVLGKLQRIDPAPHVSGRRPTPDKIIKAEVLRDRGHAYDFEKL